MHRRTFIKTLAALPSLAFVPRRPLLHAGDIISDGWDGSITYGQIVIDRPRYTDSQATPADDLAPLAVGEAAIAYQP